MKRRNRWLVGALCLLLTMGIAPSVGEDQIVIDVVEGRFVSGTKDIPLADAEQPILLEIEDGMVFVELDVPGGKARMSLGQGSVGLTERAAAYVRVAEPDVPQEVIEGSDRICEICGRTLAIGRHIKLECGHYGCLMVADHPHVCPSCEDFMCTLQDHSQCEHCGVRFCVHVDIECEYMRNPAPTAYATRDPDGGRHTFYMEPDGSAVYGSEQSASWSPGLSFVSPQPGVTTP